MSLNTYDILQEIDLFKNIKTSNLKKISKSSQILKLSTNFTLYEKAKKVEHLYILIRGAVALINETSSKKEIITDIIFRSSPINLSFISLNKPYSSNKLVTLDAETNIIKIPLEVLSQVLEKDKQFSNNVVNSLSLKTQEQEAQVTVINSHDSEYKIGWFLLYLLLFFNKDNKNIDIPYGKDVTLPVKKSIISSYLNMTPETFSRTLKNMDKYGFIVKGKKISLISEHIRLCQFCDALIGMYCNNYLLSHCPVSDA